MKAELTRLQGRGRRRGQGQRRHRRPSVDLKLELGDMSESGHRSRGRRPDAEDRPRRRGRDLRRQADRASCPSSTATSPSSSCSRPGTQRLSWNHATSENPQGSTQTMVNGQHFSGTGYQLDGTENRDPILGIIVINPTLESIGETKITSQNYDAEFGQATAGVVSVQTKSGHERAPRQRLRVPPDATSFQAREPLLAAGRARTRSRGASCPRRSATSSGARSAVRSRRTSGSSSATTRAGATRTAARSC